MRTLTAKQREALEFIAATIRNTHRPPTIMELSLYMGSSGSTRRGLGHIEALVRKGYITREPGQARSFRLTQAAQDLLEGSSPSTLRNIPMIPGERSGDLPETLIPVPGFLFGAFPDFAFSLETDVSFPDKSLCRQDILFVQRSLGDGPSDGDLVVVADPLSGKLSVGVVSKKHGLFALTPPGEAAERYVLRKKDVESRIQGRVIGLVRSLLPLSNSPQNSDKHKDSPDER